MPNLQFRLPWQIPGYALTCTHAVFSHSTNCSSFDNQKDNSLAILQKWRPILEGKGVTVIIGGHTEQKPKGVGFAKNSAVRQSHGRYLCFLDADDVMNPGRVESQLNAAKDNPDAIYTSHGPTVAMPTWFCARTVFDKVGGFDESGKGTPEDLIFFLKHLSSEGKVHRVDEHLMMYRYHPQATTHSIHRDTIWSIRLEALEDNVISNWSQFTIWSAGKQGKRFYRSLRDENKEKVIAFCEVDKKKIEKGVYIYEESKVLPKPRIPILHFTDAKPPLIICVKLDLTGGGLEKNLTFLNLQEGKDYYHFS
ncbi:putative UDP-GlcNAc:betaGal beta-1,3-N-acetylglucosaminyltransferase-like protein 1-like [Apostichopus japonicus]|uniref:Putative UDP-GlcNAc:betaGal beta-1,3-N-acetylglucosaminyltransferase-like protein 1-like n=1 Tax=Stichopus japonicus TaxID=307972 RepID=A0A2G8LHF0_STIJA|nr:putative UDP-GlcNAc:betaGal beta-1,3-N-acetylglucosaminyltransferase-like protein 1-like [Apostichopus japonicus]